MKPPKKKLSPQETIRLLEKIRKGHEPTAKEQAALAGVEALNLMQGQVKTLEKGAVYLSGLQRLHLEHRGIHTLSASLGALSELRYLNLVCPELKSLPYSIGRLTHLEYLDMFCPLLETLPLQIRELQSLKRLLISSSRLQNLTDRLGGLKSLRTLFIFCDKLKALPAEIGKLDQLETLTVSAEHLSNVPGTIGKLSSLKHLDIQSSAVRLPAKLGNLSSLESLCLKGTEVKLPESLSGLTGLKELDLTFQCRRLPMGVFTLAGLKTLKLACASLEGLDGIGSLETLQSLELSSDELFSLPPGLFHLRELEQLSLSCAKLERLPSELGDLAKLRSLYIQAPLLEALPSAISRLTALTKLVVQSSSLKTLPSQIGSLSTLRELHVSAPALRRLPEEIGRLTCLESLFLQPTALEHLPESLGNLRALRALAVSSDELRSLDVLKKLHGLESLEFHGRQIDAIPDWVGGLAALRSLDVSKTAVRRLPDRLSRLTELKNLNLTDTNLAALPDWIGCLDSLETLMAGNTKLQELPSGLSSLKKMVHLGLDGLRLHSLPRELLDLNIPFILDESGRIEGRGILLRGAALATQPISLFEQPPELIREYYDAKQIPVNEAKVIFLGDGSVGKTYTIRRMLNGCRRETAESPYRTTETHGILITPYHVERDGQSFDIHFWDFGGQDIMHSMHRCFLTERTCYVVMVSTRTPDLTTGRARYWLRNIESFAHNAPVILAVNRWGVDSPHTGLDINRLQQEFPSLVGHVSYSAMSSSEEEFRRLEEAIVEQAQRLDSCNMSFPEQWDYIRQELLKQATSHTYYIGRSDYYRICNKYGLSKSKGIRSWLLEWFNDLGVCFSYHQDSDRKELQDYKILDPQWLTSAIYRIIFGQGESHNGTISVKEIRRILGETGSPELEERGIPCLNGVSYSEEECTYVLEIMRKFKVSYQVSDESEFIPALCNENTPPGLKPEDQDHWGSVKLCYHYLPDSVVHQLMIAVHPLLQQNKCWRKGLFLEWSSYIGEREQISTTVQMTGTHSEDTELLIDFYCREPSHAVLPSILLNRLLEWIKVINQAMNLQAEVMVLAEKNGHTEWFSETKIRKCRERGSREMQGEEENYEIAELQQKFALWGSSWSEPSSTHSTLLEYWQQIYTDNHVRLQHTLDTSFWFRDLSLHLPQTTKYPLTKSLSDYTFTVNTDTMYSLFETELSRAYWKTSSKYISPSELHTALTRKGLEDIRLSGLQGTIEVKKPGNTASAKKKSQKKP